MEGSGEWHVVGAEEVLGHEAMGHAAHAEVLVGPSDQFLVASHGVAALAGLVALAADEEQFLAIGAGGRAQRTLGTIVGEVHPGGR